MIPAAIKKKGHVANCNKIPMLTYLLQPVQQLFCLLPKGNVVLHYKRYATDKWLPDADDASTFLVDEDKCGILVFKARIKCYNRSMLTMLLNA